MTKSEKLPVPRQTNRPAFRSSGRRPNRAWSSSVIAAPTNIPAATKVLVASLVLSNVNIDETLLRVVGMIGVASDQNAASEQQIGAFGMIVVTDIAIAAGVASVPGPMSNGADDWLMYQGFAQERAFGSSIGFDSEARTQYAINSKAKRVVTEGRAIALVCENLHATHGFNVVWNLRVLSMVRGTR